MKGRIEASFQGRAPPEVFPFTTRILAVDSGKIVHATTTVRTFRSPVSGHPCWFVSNYGDASISGVPGSSSPVEIANPLQRNILPTGRVLDMMSINDQMVRSAWCSIIYSSSQPSPYRYLARLLMLDYPQYSSHQLSYSIHHDHFLYTQPTWMQISN